MQRTHRMAFVLLILSAPSASLVIQLHGQSAAPPDQRQQAIAEQIDGAIDALGLYSVSDPPYRQGAYKLILSELPIPSNWHSRFVMSRPDAGSWRGTVAIYVGRPAMIQSNYDAERPERCALWAGSFVYGDPALIARLCACSP